MSSAENRRFINNSLVLKYIMFASLFAALAIVLFLFLGVEVTTLSVTELVKGAFYSVLSALLISVFYDIFARREMRASQQVELTQQREILEAQLANDRRDLSKRFIGIIDFGALPKTELDVFARRAIESEALMMAISSALMGSHAEAFHYTFIRPLAEKLAPHSVIVTNRLLADAIRRDVYWMDFQQQFNMPAAKIEFLVIFSCDNDYFNDLVTSDALIDGLIGTSESQWDDIDDQIKSLRLIASSTNSGKRIQTQLEPRIIGADDLARRLGIRNIDDAGKVRAFLFVIGSDIKNHTFTFKYKVRNSLSDPYYMWLAEIPMFVARMTIDYQHLKQHGRIGRVSANCLLGNHADAPQHDMDLGVYSVEVGGLVWPGQGAMIVWRPSSTPESTIALA